MTAVHKWAAGRGNICGYLPYIFVDAFYVCVDADYILVCLAYLIICGY